MRFRSIDRFVSIRPAAALLAAWLVCAPAMAAAAAEDVAIIKVSIDSTTKTRSYTFNVYDKITLVNGQVYFAHTAWAGRVKVKRGTPLRKLTQVQYVPYSSPVFSGAIRLRRPNIRRIEYWEDLAFAKLGELRDKARFDDARALLERLKQFNSAWRPEQVEQLAVRLMHDRAKAMSAEGQPDVVLDKGLKLLAELVKQHRQLQGLAETYANVYARLATSAKRAGTFDRTHELIDRVERVYPKLGPIVKLQTELQAEANKLLALAGKAEKAGKPQLSLRHALEALDRWRSPAVRREVSRYLQKYQVLKIACYQTAGTFEPFNATQPLERQIMPLLFERLIEPGQHGRRFFRGPLVGSFRELALGREFEFVLKPGSVFSDGTPVTAHDVEHTIRLLRNRRGEAYDPELARYLKTPQVKSPTKLSIHLVRPHPEARSLFGFPIVSARNLPELPRRGDGVTQRPVGSGPFIAALPDSQGNQRVVENKKFRRAARGQPYLKEIIFRKFTKKGSGQAVSDLEKGGIHLLSDPNPRQLLRLANAGPSFRTRPFLSNSVYVLAFNFRHAAFKNRDVRMAMLQAIDRRKILRQYYHGGGGRFAHAVVSGPFPPQSPAADPALKPRPAKPRTARERVRKLPGHLRGPFTLKYPEGDMTIELVVQQIRKDLESVGFEIRTVGKLPNDLIGEVTRDHNFDIVYWRIDHRNILLNIASMFAPGTQAMGPRGSNFMGYADPRLTQLFVDLRAEQIGDRIWKKQHVIHKFIHTEVVMIPLWRLDSFVVYTNRLVGRTSGGADHDLPIDSTHLFRRAEEWYLKPRF